jgi:flagellar protein FlbD
VEYFLGRENTFLALGSVPPAVVRHLRDIKFLANLYIAFTVNLQRKIEPYAKVVPATTRSKTKTFVEQTRKISVIYVTRRNGSKYYINPELIQTVEATPDTIITLVNNEKLIVKETAQEVAERFIEYRRKTLSPFISHVDGE